MKVCGKCRVEKELKCFSKNKLKKDGLNNRCKSCCSIQGKKYRSTLGVEESDRKNEYKKKWSEANKEKLKNYRKKWRKNNQRTYQRERLKRDPLFRMTRNLRHRAYLAFKNKGYGKNTKTKEMLGAKWEVAKKHIENQFKKGMNWDNYGEWHIDHITPLASAKDEKELIKLCHYSNLQPLWATENILKSDKIGELHLLHN